MKKNKDLISLAAYRKKKKEEGLIQARKAVQGKYSISADPKQSSRKDISVSRDRTIIYMDDYRKRKLPPLEKPSTLPSDLGADIKPSEMSAEVAKDKKIASLSISSSNQESIQKQKYQNRQNWSFIHFSGKPPKPIYIDKYRSKYQSSAGPSPGKEPPKPISLSDYRQKKLAQNRRFIPQAIAYLAMALVLAVGFVGERKERGLASPKPSQQYAPPSPDQHYHDLKKRSINREDVILGNKPGYSFD